MVDYSDRYSGRQKKLYDSKTVFLSYGKTVENAGGTGRFLINMLCTSG